MMKTKTMQLIESTDSVERTRRLAVHEAGHAVLAYSLGWEIEEVSFSPALHPESAWTSVDEPSGRSPDQAGRRAMLYLAGPAAELVVLGRYETRCSHDDFQTATSMVRRLVRMKHVPGSFEPTRIPRRLEQALPLPGARLSPDERRNVRGALLATCNFVAIWRPVVNALTRVFVDGMRAAAPGSSGIEVSGKSVTGVIRDVAAANPKLRRFFAIPG